MSRFLSRSRNTRRKQLPASPVHPDARVLNVMFAGEVARASEAVGCQVMNRVVP